MKNQISFDDLHRLVTSGGVDLPEPFLRQMRETVRRVALIAQATHAFLTKYQQENGPATPAILAQSLVQLAAAHLIVGEGMDVENFGQFARTIARIVEPSALKAHDKLSAEPPGKSS